MAKIFGGVGSATIRTPTLAQQGLDCSQEDEITVPNMRGADFQPPVRLLSAGWPL